MNRDNARITPSVGELRRREPAPGGEPRCPKCGAGNPKRIVYGLIRREPGEPAVSDPDRVYAGCMLRPENRACRECGTRYRFTPA